MVYPEFRTKQVIVIEISSSFRDLEASNIVITIITSSGLAGLK